MIVFTLACFSPDVAPRVVPPTENPGPAAPAPQGHTKEPRLRLAALVPTSGDASAMFDGNPSTGWTPAGDARAEGLLFRFEERTTVQSFTVTSCANQPFEVTPFYDGQEHETFEVQGKGGGDPGRMLRSLFLRIDSPTACIGAIELSDGEKVIDLAGPRTVKGSVSTSSTLEPAHAHHPSYLFDSRIDLGWAEGSAGIGVGETITLKLDVPLAISKLEIWNGNQRSHDHFNKNARLKKIAVSVGGAREVFDLKSVMGAEPLALAAPVKSDTVIIEILEATPGSEYRDLVISEVRLWDVLGPVAVAVAGRAARASALKAKAAGTVLGPMVDKLYRAKCDAEGPRWLKLRSDHSFVWYEALMHGTEVFDGAWVVKGQENGGMGIELFGGRHRSQETYSVEPQAKQGTRIAGGKPVFHAAKDLSAKDLADLVGSISAVAGRGCEMDLDALVREGAVLVRDPSLVDVLVPAK